MKKHFVLFGTFCAVVLFALMAVLHFRMQEPSSTIIIEETSLGTKEDPEARQRFEWMMLRDPATGQIPEDIKRKEMEFARSLPTREQLTALNKAGTLASWTSRGPWNVGGRTRALGIDVGNPNLIIAGGVSGGMWRSVDGGTTWTKTSAANSLHSVSCLAQDTRPGQTGTWYYGTGELLGNSASGSNFDMYSGDGIFKSTNSGVSWTLLPSTSTGQPQNWDNFFDYVWNIVVDPTNGNVFAATYGAIFRSTNGGTSWTTVFGGVSPFSSYTDIQVASNGTFYVTGSADGGMGGVWKSTTGAAGTWTNITPTDMLNTIRRIVIGIAPSNNNTVYIVAETPSAGVNNHSFWKYNATANSWVNRSANMPAYGGPVGNFDSQSSYDLVIKIKPDNENVVLIGGTNLYRSTDGFATTGNTAWIGGYATSNNISMYPNHHPDQHALVFAPNNASILFSAHDEGIGKTTNILANPVVWQSLSSGYLTTQFYTIAIDRGTNGSNTIIGGMQDNGCWKTTSASGTTPWTNLFSGDGAFTAIANGGGSDYVSAQNGVAYRLFGAQWTRVDPTGGTGYLFINPFVLDPNNSNIMYFAGGNYTWRNSNLTQIPAGSNSTTSVNWTRLNNSAIVGQTQVSALAVSKANPVNRLYIAHSVGYLVRVDNANTGDPVGVDIGAAIPFGFISCVAVDPTDGNKVLVVFSNYNLQSLWYSSNAGATWTDVEGNLAGATGPSCRYAAIVPISGGATYFLVGTSTGLYSTTTLNGASTVWAQEGASTIGNVVVSFLDSRPSDRLVVAATHANGVYSADIVSDVEEDGGIPAAFALHQNYPNPFNPSTKIGFGVSRPGFVSLNVYDILGREVATLVQGHLKAGSYEATLHAAGLASGVYFYRLHVQPDAAPTGRDAIGGSGFVQTRKLVLQK